MNAESPLPYRLRSELEWTPIHGRRRDWWVVSDPFRLELSRCGDLERQLLPLLDGRRTLSDITRLISRHSIYRSISIAQVRRIVFSAIQNRLLTRCDRLSSSAFSSVNSSDDELSRSSTGDSKSAAWSNWFLSIQRWPWFFIQGKTRLADIERWLQPLAKRTDWLFSRLAVYVWMTFIGLVALLVISKLAARSSIEWSNIIPIQDQALGYLAILLTTRVVHEMGHAIVCTRLGARCRDFGIFIMLGMVCPYVDVSDSWRLKDYRHRMAVAAAGVYVEWILAALAGLIWYLGPENWLTMLAWQVMLTCSLTTLLFNANPLMRYDGYFILSDFLDVGNLREEADAMLRSSARKWLLGGAPDVFLRELSWRKAWLLIYALASKIYRCFLTVAVVWTIYLMMKNWNLPVLGLAFIALSIVSFLLIPLGKTMVRSWTTARTIRWGRFRALAIAAGVLILLVKAVIAPIPNRIPCHGLAHPAHRSFVYTQASGRIPEHAIVSAESPENLMVLDNPWLTDQARLTRYQQQQLETRLHSLRMASYQRPMLTDQIPALKSLMAVAEKQTRHADDDLDRLKIVKPSHGRWIPMELPIAEAVESDRSIDRGETIDHPQNRGRWLPAGTPIGCVAPSDRIWIDATVSVAHLNDIETGMNARVRFDQMPDRVFLAHVVEVSRISTVPSPTIPSRKSSRFDSIFDGNSIIDRNESDAIEEADIFVSLAVDQITQNELALGGTAQVVIWAKPKSLVDQLFPFASEWLGSH